MLSAFRVALLFLMFLPLIGCQSSDGIKKYQVTGTITYDGQPIEEGTIVFDPATPGGMSAMGSIKDGKVDAQVTAGEMIVRVTAIRTLDKKDQYGEAITESYIPEKYNLNSELKATITADGENTLSFDLEK